jgi:sRNA-binding carbon storage regulator CsrA
MTDVPPKYGWLCKVAKSGQRVMIGDDISIVVRQREQDSRLSWAIDAPKDLIIRFDDERTRIAPKDNF